MLQSALMMLSAFMFQVGGRTMQPIELTHAQKALLKSPVSRHLLLFSGLYITVRNFFGALFLYAVAILLLYPQIGLLSETSPWSLMPGWAKREGFEAARREDAIAKGGGGAPLPFRL